MEWILQVLFKTQEPKDWETFLNREREVEKVCKWVETVIFHLSDSIILTHFLMGQENIVRQPKKPAHNMKFKNIS